MAKPQIDLKATDAVLNYMQEFSNQDCEIVGPTLGLLAQFARTGDAIEVIQLAGFCIEELQRDNWRLKMKLENGEG